MDDGMKVIELEAMAERIRALKERGKVVVYCHGCFDLPVGV